MQDRICDRVMFSLKHGITLLLNVQRAYSLWSTVSQSYTGDIALLSITAQGKFMATCFFVRILWYSSKPEILTGATPLIGRSGLDSLSHLV